MLSQNKFGQWHSLWQRKDNMFYSAPFHCSWQWSVEWLVDAFASEFMLPKESREKQAHQAGLWFTRSVGLTMIVESHGSVCTVEGTTVWLSHQKGGEAWESGMAHLQPMTINAPTKGLCWSSTLPPNSSWSYQSRSNWTCSASNSRCSLSSRSSSWRIPQCIRCQKSASRAAWELFYSWSW